MEANQYLDYFRFRGVTPDEARDAPLPPWMQKVLPLDKSAAILDIGCGFGRMLGALRRAGYGNISGIDLEDAAIDHCRGIGLDVAKASILEYSARDRRYDIVIMSHVLEHLPKEKTIAVLSSIGTGLLKESGALLVMVPNAQSHTGCYWMYEDWTHETLFTAGSLLYVLRVAGFQDIVFHDPDGIEGVDWKRRIIKRMLLRYYDARLKFWNRVTSSSFHIPSPRIYSFELKAVARYRSHSGNALSP